MGIRDGLHTIVLNNQGENPEGVSPELVSFLRYTTKPLSECMEGSDDPFVCLIQDRIRWVKASREMREMYMKLQELLQEERQEGRI